MHCAENVLETIQKFLQEINAHRVVPSGTNQTPDAYKAADEEIRRKPVSS